jgi:glucose/arabinose dehydrogenase
MMLLAHRFLKILQGKIIIPIISSRFILTTFSTAVLFSNCAAFGPGGSVKLDKIKLPAGFKIDFYAPNVPGARSLTLSPSGIIYVGSRSAGNVYALLDTNHDARADQVILIASGLSQPNGVTFYNGDLYVAEAYRIIRFDNIEKHLGNPSPSVLINDSFPPGGEHSWKYLRIGSDSMLYVSVGSPFNVGIPDDNRYATIIRMKPDGSKYEIYARGIRNSVGFDWHPITKELWFNDNGRDWLGDNLPPDELNHAKQKGLNFGWPYFFGKNVPDPKYGTNAPNEQFTPSALDLGAHVAPLGMRFYTGTMFPEKYHNQIFIAEHGSWNRTMPIGYRVIAAYLQGDSAVSYEVFASGWLQGISAWGRPVDIQVMPDGALLVSDDKAGAVYRISYQKQLQYLWTTSKIKK